jgi:signal transduction histidine kinase/ligand-binding sensor domain-containing protein
MNRNALLVLVVMMSAVAPLAKGAPPLSAEERRRAEAGQPFVTWRGMREYNGEPQVFSIMQADNGLLYVGHNAGLSEFDGSTWRVIAVPHSSVIRSMAKGPDGRIYLGEIADFGYLGPDERGQTAYHSLIEYVPHQYRDFEDVFRVVWFQGELYVQARQRVLRLTPDGHGWKTTSWTAPHGFAGMRTMDGSIIVTTTDYRVMRLRDDRLEELHWTGIGGTLERALTAVAPYARPNENDRRTLLGTRDGRLYLWDGKNALQPFATELVAQLRDLHPNGAVQLPDGSFAIGTVTGGCFLIEHDGRLRQYLERAQGIQSNGVLTEYVDNAGALWLGLESGLARVDATSPITAFPGNAETTGAVNAMARYHGEFYVGMMGGLERLNVAKHQFELVPGTKGMTVFGLLTHGDSLLMATDNSGLLEYKDGRLRTIVPSRNGMAYFLPVQSKQDPSRIWICTFSGLAALRHDQAGQWVDEGIVAKTQSIRTLAEPEPGLIWLGSETHGVVRVRVNGNELAHAQVTFFDKKDGLPWDGGVDAVAIGEHVVFLCAAGIREFEEKSGRFVASKEFGSIPFSADTSGSNAEADSNGTVWLNTAVRITAWTRRVDGHYTMNDTALRQLPEGLMNWMHVDEGDVVWSGGFDALYRYDPAKAVTRVVPPPAVVRRVSASQHLIYGGALAVPERAEIGYGSNSLRFEYAQASFEDPVRNRYRTLLEGFDRDWAPWTAESHRDYTNLPPGAYRFRVRAINALGEAAPAEGLYSFEILPPWYRTWWAWTLWALIGTALAYAAARAVRIRATVREQARSRAKMLEAEIERKRNVELLSEMGKELTSSLDIDTIFVKLHESVNQLMDAAVFGVGIYHPSEHAIEYRLAIESGKRYQPYRRDTRDKNQFPVWCIDHREPVFVNDVAAEYSRYIEKYEESASQLEDGSVSQKPQSLIYLPLIAKDQVLGILSVQSFRKNAYTEYHLNLLQNLAAYTSIALDNADAYQHLKSAQEQLVVQEKLASLGALTAGIAHEIKNPLNFVNNFADLSVELMAELREELDMQKASIPAAEYGNIALLLDDLTVNAKKINEHGRRADGIVRSMLQHSRGQAGEHQPTDINAMLDEYVNLAYHGMRAQDASFNVTIERQFDAGAGMVDAVPQDISRVFLNILNNACYAANDKARKAGAGFAPTLIVRTVNRGDAVEVRIRDNGMGIPADVRDRIFNPFFTTKPTGQGTGLGLSISHDIIVQEHGGQLEVETEPGEFTEFVVRLPRQWRKAA